MLSLVSTITSCVSISAFVSLVCVPVAITSSAVGIKICAITAGTRKYKSIIKKKKKKHDKIAFLGKDKLNTIEILISKVLIDAYFRHDEFVSIINVLREYNKIKGNKNFCEIHYTKAMETYCVSCKKNTENRNSSVRNTKQNRLMLLSNCAICGKKKSTFIKNHFTCFK